MTTEEHQLIILMFARINEALSIITNTLKSKGVWTGDDQRAFEHIAHADDANLFQCVQQATSDYLVVAKGLGVDTGIRS